MLKLDSDKYTNLTYTFDMVGIAGDIIEFYFNVFLNGDSLVVRTRGVLENDKIKFSVPPIGPIVRAINGKNNQIEIPQTTLKNTYQILVDAIVIRTTTDNTIKYYLDIWRDEAELKYDPKITISSTAIQEQKEMPVQIVVKDNNIQEGKGEIKEGTTVKMPSWFTGE